MHRSDVFEPFGGKGLGEILFTDTIDTVSGEFLPPLIDEKAVLV